VVAFSSEAKDEIQEFKGKMSFSDQGLMHSVLENKEKRKEAKLIKEAVNQGLGAFVPDDIYENLVNNFSNAERLYGKTFLNLVSGYDFAYLERNMKIPEFQRELKKKIENMIERLEEEGLVDGDGQLTSKAEEAATLILYVEELENIVPKGILGEKLSKRVSHYGERGDVKNFKKGDRYRDLSLRRSVKKAIKRGHKELMFDDLEIFERQAHGSFSVIYGVDASGSMKGKKIDMAKKAGVALAFKAIERKDKVGLVVFSKEIEEAVVPTDDFALLMKKISGIKASKETDLVKMVQKASELFPKGDFTKHLLVLTDALPNIGRDPGAETLEAVSIAKAAGITVSLVGINLDSKGEELAKKIVELGDGRLFVVKDLDELDKVVLEDYYSL
jgi:Mg-chelatase subunit ChlD